MDLNSTDFPPIFNVQQPGCPSPLPFIQNTNSTMAYLRGNIFNGTQPKDAGNYTCFADGVPRATVEVVVLSMFSTFFFMTNYSVLMLIIIAVPQSSTQSEAFFRLSVISQDMLAQALGEPLILSDCIQTLGTLVC